MEKDIYKTSRILYVIEATLEYFISLLVAGAYLAKLTTSIGLPDSLTAILTSFVSLGCGFQLVAIFISKNKSVKRYVTILHTVNQLLFALIYFVPFIEIPKTAKFVVFAVLLLSGHAINQIVNSPKINWYMSLIDDKKRGKFTANKEIVSLITGVIFTTTMSSIIDAFEASGNLNGAFIFCGLGVFGLAILHSLTLIFSKEKPIEESVKTTNNQSIKGLLTDKPLLKVILVSALWYVANYSTTPFYGTYQIKELGFTMLLVSILSAIGAFSRALFSRPFGKFADKYSFSKLINLCFIIEFFAFLVNVFTVPAYGKITYSIYLILYSIGMAGINSCAINLIYDYVDKQKRTSALALKSTICGLVGFLTTTLVSLLVDKIQANGNTFLGISVYAQQVVSVIGVLVMIVAIVYVNTVIKKIKSQ